MRIESIEIEGLWSYRDEQHVDISGLPLLVGVGENGTGKSTLLVSSLLVAFYAKFPTKTIEESITTGAAQGRVSVEFTVNGTRYRVSRVFPRKGTASGMVMIEDATQPTGWRSVTEKGVREVTAYIVDLLGMDHETATMTWIAEQGQYGKFASAAPADRFKLLSGVFGLDEYSTRAAAATDRVRTLDAHLEHLNGQISELRESMLDAADGDEDNAALTDEQISEQIAEAEAGIDHLTTELANLAASDPAKATVEARQALELVRNERQSLLTLAATNVERAKREREAALQRASAATTAAAARRDDAVAASRQRVEAARDTAEQTRKSSAATLNAITAAEREVGTLRAAVESARSAAAQQRTAAESASAEVEAATARRAKLKGEYDALKADAAKIAERIARVRALASEGDHATCYACGQHLSADDAAALIASQEAEVATITARLDEIRPEGTAAANAVTAATETRTAATCAAEQHETDAQSQQAELARIEHLISTRDAVQDALDNVDVVVTRTERDERATQAAAEAAFEAAIADAESDIAEATADADLALAEWQPVAEKNAQPTTEEVRLEQAYADAQARVADAAAAVSEQRTRLESERADLRARVNELVNERARRNEAATARAEQQARLDTLTSKHSKVSDEKNVYATLVKAYSPTGIPAMILTGVIDELNEAVNATLERVSRGTLSVQMQTSRENQRGGVENKVTVYVETPTGVRAYETLSGGQRFRVDLAIRSGLARAIARGTGTPIETFILDEGWGSLDEKGIVSTADALTRLSEEANVITVSHIDTVRDAFPARIEVSATSGTSVAEVIR